MPITVSDITTFLTLVRKAIGSRALHSLLDQIDAADQGVAMPQIPGLETTEELLTGAGILPPMLVDRLLPDNNLFLLTGKPKTGKSFLALDIADSVARGVPVLGALSVNRPGPVLYLALEDGKQEIARRLTQRNNAQPAPSTKSTMSTSSTISPSRPIRPGPPSTSQSSLYFITEPFALTDPLHHARFREQAAVLRPSLIVIDTAAEALDIRDWINRAEILAKIAPIRRLARDLCTILLVAHNRKAEGDGGDEIAGSNALAGAVDGWISAHKVERRPDGNRRLFLRVEGRGGVGHELIAEMDRQTLHFRLIPAEQAENEDADARDRAHDARRKARHTETLHALERLGSQATISRLAAAMGITYRTAWSLVRELIALEEVEEDSNTERTKPDRGMGRPSPAYRVKTRREGLIS